MFWDNLVATLPTPTQDFKFLRFHSQEEIRREVLTEETRPEEGFVDDTWIPRQFDDGDHLYGVLFELSKH